MRYVSIIDLIIYVNSNVKALSTAGATPYMVQCNVVFQVFPVGLVSPSHTAIPLRVPQGRVFLEFSVSLCAPPTLDTCVLAAHLVTMATGAPASST